MLHCLQLVLPAQHHEVVFKSGYGAYMRPNPFETGLSALFDHPLHETLPSSHENKEGLQGSSTLDSGEEQ